ncbi:MAG TPA: glycosyltransferase family 87 protein [Urbifossiella sp.]|jgi:hypothetical protein|nr:glycosyltransferase family 87 protein [Urbifossiella sp.]
MTSSALRVALPGLQGNDRAMTDPSPCPPAAAGPVWFATPRFRIAVLVVMALALAGEGAMAVFVRVNDVANHYHQGYRLLHADPDAGAECFKYVPYPAGRATLNAALAWLPYRAFRATLFVLAVAALVGAFTLWERMAARTRPVRPEARFVAGVATVVLLGPWVARDLDDCGLQILLLFMLSASLSLTARGRDGAAAAWLGTAIAYKATPLLVVPFAMLTGRWRAAAGAVAVAVALCLSPALFIGWDRAVELNRGFIEVAVAGVRAGEPGENGFEPPRHKNQGLVLALARATRTYPPDHPLYLSHPLFVQFLDLPPRVAGAIAAVVVGAGLAALTLHVRRVRRDGTAADLVREWAVVCFLCALLSPVCWGPHLVLGLPAAYLVLRDGFDRLARGVRPRWRVTAGLAVVAGLIHGFPRELLGAELSVLALSYKPYTLSAVVLMGLVLALPAAGGGSGLPGGRESVVGRMRFFRASRRAYPDRCSGDGSSEAPSRAVAAPTSHSAPPSP